MNIANFICTFPSVPKTLEEFTSYLNLKGIPSKIGAAIVADIWDGYESNQIGTREFIEDFIKDVEADPEHIPCNWMLFGYSDITPAFKMYLTIENITLSKENTRQVAENFLKRYFKVDNIEQITIFRYSDEKEGWDFWDTCMAGDLGDNIFDPVLFEKR